jgi:DNA-binding response OmpR family regulator
MGLDILLASPHQSDHDSLADILCGFKCGLHFCQTRREVLSLLRDHSPGVIIADASLPDGTWKDLLNDLSILANAPNVIVISRLADERLWAEVLNMGGYDLLMTPYDPNEVVRVTAMAWLDWERKRTVGYQKATGVSRGSSDLARRAAVAQLQDQEEMTTSPAAGAGDRNEETLGYAAGGSRR